MEIAYTPGTRLPERASLRLTERGDKSLDIKVESLGYVALHVGAGYGGDPDWSHGQWRGRRWVEGAVYDLTDPAIVARMPFGVIDHVGRATCDGAEGWGLFETGRWAVTTRPASPTGIPSRRNGPPRAHPAYPR